MEPGSAQLEPRAPRRVPIVVGVDKLLVGAIVEQPPHPLGFIIRRRIEALKGLQRGQGGLFTACARRRVGRHTFKQLPQLAFVERRCVAKLNQRG